MTYWVRILLITNIIMFALTWMMPVIPLGYVAFRPQFFFIVPWTIITYMWIHGGPLHIFFNMFMLWQFGTPVEGRMGSRWFIAFYLFSGISAAGLHWMLENPAIPIIGASGAVSGVMLAFARYWPEARLALLGVIPMRARTMVAVFVFASIFLARSPIAGNIAHFAHLGGLAGGYIFMRLMEHFSGAARFKRKVYQKVQPSVRGDQELVDKARRANREAMHEINRSEFDRVMAKVEVEGVRSLTLEERAFLDRVS